MPPARDADQPDPALWPGHPRGRRDGPARLPVAGGLLFELERLADWPFFDPIRGGDPLLWQHPFWILGYSWIALAAVGTGFLSFGRLVRHMFAVGLPSISQASRPRRVLGAGAVRLGCSCHPRHRRAHRGHGGAGPIRLDAHDTCFAVARLHYVLIGGMLFPVVAGIYYCFPLLGSRKLSEKLGRWAFWLMFVGFDIGFLPMRLSGLRGTPWRVFTYPTGLGLDRLNLVPTIGAFVFAAGVLLVVLDVLRPKRRAPFPARNPWHAGTLEWTATIPSESGGTRSVPAITSRYPLWELPGSLGQVDTGAFYLPDAEEQRRETIITSPLDAGPIQCLRLADPGGGFRSRRRVPHFRSSAHAWP